MKGFGFGYGFARTGGGGGVVSYVASWLLPLLGLGHGTSTSTGTNRTVLAFLDDAEPADGMLVITVADVDDIGIQDGCRYESATQTYHWTTRLGVILHPFTDKQTPNGAVRTLDVIQAWKGSAAVVTGQRVRLEATEGLHVYGDYTGNGTSSASQPTVSTSDIGGSAVTDNDTSINVLGYATVEGLFSGLAATNQITQSESLDDAAWTKAFSSIDANATTAPDGNVTADKIMEEAVSNGHSAFQTIANLGDSNFSAFVDAGGRDNIALRYFIASNNYGTVVYNISTGQITQNTISGSTITDIIPSIQKTSLGFHRCSIAVEKSSGSTFVAIDSVNQDTPPLNANGAASFLGDITKGPIVWGVQVTDGLALLPYTATGAGTVTRAATETTDDASKTGLTGPTGAYSITFNPYDLMDGSVVAGSEIDALNGHTLSYTGGTVTLTIAKGGETDVVVTDAYTPVVGLAAKIDVSYDSSGNASMRAYSVGDALPVFETAALGFDVPLGTELYTGSDGAGGLQGPAWILDHESWVDHATAEANGWGA